MEVDGGAWVPEDVIFAVLSWLPVKPLCRFRCVCKGWRALISSAAFVAAQKSRAAPLLVGAFEDPLDEKMYSNAYELRVMDADGNVLRVLSYEMRTYTTLLPTRLDLVCVDMLGAGASVVDPATGGVVTVAGRIPGDDDPLFLEKMFGQTNWFGRAAQSGAYKVVRLHDEFLGSSEPVVVVCGQRCEVATLGDGGGGAEPAAWRQRPAPPFLTCCEGSCPVTVNGVAYFFPRVGECNRRGHQGWNNIASFDLESEDWKKVIYAPEHRLGRSWDIVVLGELKGTLCAVETLGRYTSADIWVLADGERSIWVKQYRIRSPDSSFMVKPMEVLPDGRLLLWKTIREACGRSYSYTHILQLYDQSTGTITDLRQMPKEFRGMMTLYTGSILSQL